MGVAEAERYITVTSHDISKAVSEVASSLSAVLCVLLAWVVMTSIPHKIELLINFFLSANAFIVMFNKGVLFCFLLIHLLLTSHTFIELAS